MYKPDFYYKQKKAMANIVSFKLFVDGIATGNLITMNRKSFDYMKEKLDMQDFHEKLSEKRRKQDEREKEGNGE